MTSDLIQTLSFVLITLFTPGPNTVSSASMGLSAGFGKTRPYRLGIFSGFFLIMLCCALLSGALFSRFPAVERYLAPAGALYIFWLAIHLLRSEYGISGQKTNLLGFKNGILLQLFNPKVIIFGLTVYTVYLRNLRSAPLLLPLSALILALLSFSATSLWAACGSGTSRIMEKGILRKAVNLCLSLLLMFSALKMSGLMELFHN